MITVISTCQKKIAELEFVDPIARIAKKFGKVEICSYREIPKESSAYIISGTSLMDFDYMNFEDNFYWIKKSRVLGICAGFQIISRIFGEKIEDGGFIGVKETELGKSYFLFSKHVKKFENFKVLASANFPFGTIPIFVKHKNLPIYATLFHPEVYNQFIIEKFLMENAEGRI